MPDSPPPLEERLRALDEAVGDLSRRLARLEQTRHAFDPLRPDAASENAGAAAPPGAPTSAAIPPGDFAATLSLAGRTVVVLGGAFLLRALAESGRVPETAGLALGLTYAVAWNVAANRAAGAKRPLSALFHGLAAIVIGLPIVVEASVRFHSLSPAWAAAMLVVTTGTTLGVAAHRRLTGLAIAATASAIVAAGVLAATGYVVPLAWALGVLALGTLWASDARDWPWLRWAPTIAADILTAFVLLRLLVVPPAEAPDAAIALLVVTGLSYLAWFGVRLSIGRARAGAFEFTQAAAVILLGVAAGAVLRETPAPQLITPLRAIALLAGLANYALALVVSRRRADARVNMHLFGAVALALVLASVATATRTSALAFGFAAASMALAAAAARWREPVALLHSAVFAVGAALASGLFALVALIWFAAPTAWPALPAEAAIVLVTAAATLAVASMRRPPASRLDATARLILGAVIAAGIASSVVVIAGPMLLGAQPAPGLAALLKTSVLAAEAMLLAAASRRPATAALGRLAYAALVLGAIKLAAEDFRYSRPATLFVALAIYGIALIAVPRLLRTPDR